MSKEPMLPSWEDAKDWLTRVVAGAYGLGVLVLYPIVTVIWLYRVPDANGDGAFTISDLSAGAWRSFAASGVVVTDALGDGVWRFFEINRSEPDGVAFWILGFAGWTLLGAAVIVFLMVLDWIER